MYRGLILAEWMIPFLTTLLIFDCLNQTPKLFSNSIYRQGKYDLDLQILGAEIPVIHQHTGTL